LFVQLTDFTYFPLSQHLPTGSAPAAGNGQIRAKWHCFKGVQMFSAIFHWFSVILCSIENHPWFICFSLYKTNECYWSRIYCCVV